MTEDQFYERVSILVISSGVKYEAVINIYGSQYASTGTTYDEAKENLWDYLQEQLKF